MAKANNRKPARGTRGRPPAGAEAYKHREAKSLLRPDVGTQAQFRKKKAPRTYLYDSSLSPTLEWDGQNPARDVGEWLLALAARTAALPPPHALETPESMSWNGGQIEVRTLTEALDHLKRLGRPFLNWAGRAERLSFDVPTLPLFVHERLSTKGILETLKGHRRDRQLSLGDLFGDPQHPVVDQILKAYEYQDDWTNRMILGDSLVVMNSLLEYEGLGGQVQMIYMDPPYGVRFGSNFQPFVRKRDVKHNDDEDMTREPEMVKAYRDTWELGLHSYLTYMRDRLFLARELLTSSGSIFVQISDENLHHVREVMDEVFGSANFVVVICYRRLGMMVGETIQSSAHYLLWYARDKTSFRPTKLFEPQIAGVGTGDHYTQVEAPGGTTRSLTAEERVNPKLIPDGWRPFQLVSLTTGGFRPNTTIDYSFEGHTYHPGANKCWRTTREGLDRLVATGRIVRAGNTLRYKQYLVDFPLSEITTIWDDTARDPENFYVVQTPSNVVRRCLLMATKPGDLVLDPTCGSGTMPYVAEYWGRRWIAIDTSRVPLALARQRVLTATFPYFVLKDESRGPVGGFEYERADKTRNARAVGPGVVAHIKLENIANQRPPEEEVLVDRPERDAAITRVSGPFCVEATIPTPVDWEGDGTEDSGEEPEAYGSFIDRMIEILRRSPVLHAGGGKTVTLTNIRRPAKSLSLSAEATVVGTDLKGAASVADVVQEAVEKSGDSLPFSQRRVALVFGPENGAVSESLVYQAAREAHGKGYDHLYVIGFAIQPHARTLVESCESVVGVAATYIQATPDIMMGDLLKTMRTSQIFSVCGLPEIAIRKGKSDKKGEEPLYTVELLGLDVFDPSTMTTEHRDPHDVPAWFLDTDYNNLCFHVGQAFFPRTSAWDALKKSLKAEFEDTVWDHLADTTSAPFEAGEHKQVAVKVIDDRGNELLVVQPLSAAKA